ncbi:hypothetical protein [Psychroserpens sp.]|uniref:hypothetical protein n=1 Tax=Psychroserpens sp. TaxID=2020870 RepID=UPI003C708410
MSKLKFLIFLIPCILLSCSKDSNDILMHVEGYWEIEEVTLSNGVKKAYNFNDTIDYIELSDSLTGFRKKLKPNFRGTYDTSKSSESFIIKIESDSVNVYYETLYATWKETILEADEMHLLVVNANQDHYLYKRYQPLDLDLETE